MFKETLKISQDGDKVCVLAGENLQEGICGFGDDIPAALKDFAESWESQYGKCSVSCFGLPVTPITDPKKLEDYHSIKKT